MTYSFFVNIQVDSETYALRQCVFVIAYSMCSKSYAKPGITSVFLLTYTLLCGIIITNRAFAVDYSIA